MQDVQTLSRRLLPPGRFTTCTVWTFGSHRRLVRRWECDTDLPKPGPFPQISHTAAMVQTPQVSGSGNAQLGAGPVHDTDCRGQPPKRSTAAGRVPPVLSPPLASLNKPANRS